ncbi:hypothetical protein [uncultured Clostridium sp.]|uniref:hypothetical protein n=1 Tax=uncultured Clostridium sp. TaxID=59620 RepID=UPI002614D24D|nr:hypothetical protein [uncultured Clostridium sp.]
MQKQDDKFKKMESRLYNYFENIKAISKLKGEILELDKAYEETENTLKNNKFDFDISLGSPAFEERVQTSCSGESAVEKQMLLKVNTLLKEQKLIRKKQFKKNAKIREIERNNINLRVAISMLEREEKKLIYFKYNEKFSIRAISDQLNCSVRTAHRLRKLVIDKLIKLA